MCTVIYIPTENGSYMCSVRDESPLRAHALFPAKITGEKYHFWAPIDPKAGGTWWAINEIGSTILLLNGAFTNHLPITRLYQKSRGLIVKELSQEDDFEAAWEQMDLGDTEPFTLVMKHGGKVYESRWNGKMKSWKEMDPKQAHIWSSVPLYSPEIRRQRELLFYDFISKPISKITDIEDFLYKHNDPDNGFIMHRFEQLRSLSISVFDFNDTSSEVEIHYRDLLTGEYNFTTVQLNKA